MVQCGKCCKKEKQEGLSDINRDRGFTDILCLVIFIAFLGTVGALAIIGLTSGSPDSLMYGTDHSGNVCGSPNLNVKTGKVDQTAKKHIVYPRMTEDMLTQMQGGAVPTDIMSMKFFGICVKSCPKQGEWVCTDDYAKTTDSELQECASESGGGAFASFFPYTNTKCENIMANCFKTPVDTYDVFFRCIGNYTEQRSNYKVDCQEPNGTSATSPKCQTKKTSYTVTKVESAQRDVVAEQLGNTVVLFGQLIKDLELSMVPIFVVGCGVAVVLGFLYLTLLRFFAKCMVWTTVFAAMLSFIIGSAYTLYKAGFIKASDLAAASKDISGSASAGNDVTGALDSVDTGSMDVETWKIISYIVCVITIVFLMVIVFMWRKINIAAAIIQEASKAVKRMMMVITFPLTTVISVVCVFALWLYCFMGLYTAGEIKVKNMFADGANMTAIASSAGNKTNSATMSEIELNQFRDYMIAYWIFALLWLANFCMGVAIMTICGAFAEWYWTKGEPERFPVTKSLWRTVRYHLGSVAFGSLLIALVQFMRIILEYVDSKTKTLQEKNKGMKYLIIVLKCVLACFEKCVKYLTRSAYIVIAIKGTNFCSAGFTVFGILTKHTKQVGITMTIAGFMMLLGKVVILAGCIVVGFIWLDTDKTLGISSPILPLLAIALLSYLIGSAFLYVYDLGIETILISFCIDKDENKPGSYRASDSLARAAGMKTGDKQPLPDSAKEVASSYVVPEGEEPSADQGPGDGGNGDDTDFL